MSSFEVWKQNQKLYNELYYSIVQEQEKAQSWRNKELSWGKRYKLWLKGFSAFYAKRVAFAEKLEEEIFRNGKQLSADEARALF